MLKLLMYEDFNSIHFFYIIDLFFQQLRTECDELRRSEKYLKRNVDDLNRLFEPSTGRVRV